jgi:Thermostable hemolysin
VSSPSEPVSRTTDATLGDSLSVGCSRHVLSAFERDDVRRRGVERFIERAFALRHGAAIRSFMPTLLALEGRDERVCGVVGFRNAATEPLFLERYLEMPIEQALGQRTGHAIAREQIVEVGNLASLSCRAAFHLAAMLPRVLIERGNRWIVFTATHAVRGMLSRFDAPLIDLGGARRERVEGLGDDWGRYYENDPRVMAGFLADGLALSFSRARGARCAP